MKCNIIGAGRLGTNLACALGSLKEITLLAVCNKTLPSSKNAVKQIAKGLSFDNPYDLPAADLVFLTTPDDQLMPLICQLEKAPNLKQGSVIVHCSGALPSSILQPLKSKGCLIASVHPLKAFKKENPNPDAFKNVDCIIEGDIDAQPLLGRLYTALGAVIHHINPEQKAAYHAAAVFASNYLITLADRAVFLMEQAGIDQEQAYPMVTRLMQSSLNNLKATNNCEEALTGPLSRGDHETIHRHLNVMKDKITSNLYMAAAQATLPITQLSEQEKIQLLSLFKHKHRLECDKV